MNSSDAYCYGVLSRHNKEFEYSLTGFKSGETLLSADFLELDTDNKNNSQINVYLQESIYLQSEQARKVGAERQHAEAKAKEYFEPNVATNAKAIDAPKS